MSDELIAKFKQEMKDNRMRKEFIRREKRAVWRECACGFHLRREIKQCNNCGRMCLPLLKYINVSKVNRGTMIGIGIGWYLIAAFMIVPLIGHFGEFPIIRRFVMAVAVCIVLLGFALHVLVGLIGYLNDEPNDTVFPSYNHISRKLSERLVESDKQTAELKKILESPKIGAEENGAVEAAIQRVERQHLETQTNKLQIKYLRWSNNVEYVLDHVETSCGTEIVSLQDDINACAIGGNELVANWKHLEEVNTPAWMKRAQQLRTLVDDAQVLLTKRIVIEAVRRVADQPDAVAPDVAMLEDDYAQEAEALATRLKLAGGQFLTDELAFEKFRIESLEELTKRS